MHEQAKNPGIATIYERSLPPGPHTPALLIIGQNPGYDEDRFNEPFVGRSGVSIRGGTLRKWGTRIEACKPDDPGAVTIPEGAYIDGFSLRSLASIYLTNITRCFVPGNPTPTPKQCKLCWPHTRADLDAIIAVHHSAPVCILFVSAPAVTAVFKHAFAINSVSQSRSFTINGSTQSYKGRDIHVFSTYHPAAEMRNSNLRIAINNHLHLLQDFLRGRKPLSSKPRIIPVRPPHPEEPPTQ